VWGAVVAAVWKNPGNVTVAVYSRSVWTRNDLGVAIGSDMFDLQNCVVPIVDADIDDAGPAVWGGEKGGFALGNVAVSVFVGLARREERHEVDVGPVSVLATHFWRRFRPFNE